MIRFVRVSVVAALGAGAIALTACGRLAPAGSVGPGSSANPSEVSTPAPSGVAAGPTIVALDALNEKAGWVLTDRGLLATNDGGESWRTLPLTSVAGAHSLVVRDETHLAIGRIDGLDVFVDASDDGGQTWNETRLPVQGQPGDVQLAASTTLLAVLVQQTTSANFSQADLFVSLDGGAFQKRSAPAAGQLGVTGTGDLWLAGGVLGNQLWHSDDAAAGWREVQLPAGLRASVGIAAPFLAGAEVVLPVTLNGAQSREAWLGSSDGGRTWRQLALVTVGGDTGQGVALPAAHAGDRILVVSPVGGLFSTTAAGQALPPISPNGLPVGVMRLKFTSVSSGWALVVENGCHNGKSDCHSQTSLFKTTDGGQTWSRLGLPS